MKVTRLRDLLNKPFTIRDLASGYTNNDDGATTDAVKGYNGNLNIRPSYQRNSVYNEDKRQAVIQTVLDECPLGIMYWVDLGDGQYEVLDGQQRILAICNKDKKGLKRYVRNDFYVPRPDTYRVGNGIKFKKEELENIDSEITTLNKYGDIFELKPWKGERVSVLGSNRNFDWEEYQGKVKAYRKCLRELSAK